MRPLDADCAVNRGSERMPVTGDTPHPVTPGALGDPDGIVSHDTRQRHRGVGGRVFGFASRGVTLRGHVAPTAVA